jgi:hypothetical protein
MKINNENFITFAMRHYDNANCESLEEFREDVSRVKYVKRLLNRYVETGELKERLILNHLVLLYNVFGSAATEMLFHRLAGMEHMLKPFLIALGRLPEHVTVDGRRVRTTDFAMDQNIVDALRRI